MKILYTTQSTATGGRTGSAETADGAFKVTLDTPKELGGAGGAGANPEQLFATGYAACFLGAMKFVAAKEKIKLPDDLTVAAKVGIGPRDDGEGFGLEVDLTVAIPGFERADVEALAEKAHVVCPYSHIAKNGVDVGLSVA